MFPEYTTFFREIQILTGTYENKRPFMDATCLKWLN